MALSELADWWDGQKQQSEKILTEWVQDNPQWWAVGLAGLTQTSMDLGAGMVDVLRFGQGAAEGGWRGYGKDALRLLVLLGPLGRAGGALSRLIHGSRIRMAVQVGGVDGPCTFQAVNNAMSITAGKNVFITVRDMAKAMGQSVSQLRRTAGGTEYELGAWVDELVPFLQKLGARVKPVNGLQSVDEVIALAQKESGPVVFAFRATVRNAAGVNEEILHSIIAMRSPLGGVRFADYGGRFVKSLHQLLSQWGTPVGKVELFQSGMSAAIINRLHLTGDIAVKLAKGAAVVIEGLAAIETVDNGVELAIPAAFAATPAPSNSDPANNDVIKGSFEAYKARAQGRPVIQMPPIYITAGKRSAPPVSWLTGVQFRLNALGFAAGPVDGVMGPRTKRAVTTFQSTYPPLRADGVPGPRTQAKLAEICGY